MLLTSKIASDYHVPSFLTAFLIGSSSKIAEDRPSAMFMQTSPTCQGWVCCCCCCCWPKGCCWESDEVAGGVTGVQPLRFCCCWKCEGCRRSVPPGLIGDGDDGTALCVDDRATVEDGWGDGPDERLLWYEPNSPYPRVLPEGKTDNFVGSSECTDWWVYRPKKRERWCAKICEK